MKKSFLLLLIVFTFLYVLNIMTPMLNEDYFAVFVWPQGVPNLGVLPENVKRVSCLTEFFENIKTGYLNEGGRLPGGIPGAGFSLIGKDFFNPLNALVMVLLIMEIYWISHEGKVTFDFDVSYLFWIFFCLWAFNPSLVDSCLWMSGSSNYLWMMVVVLAFLIPYVQSYYNESLLQKDSLSLTLAMFFLGVFAGWSHETTVCWIILALFYWLYKSRERNNCQHWKIFGFLGLCIGYSLLVFAPGNFARLQNAGEQTGAGLGFIGHDLFFHKLVELSILLFFQIFLWHFLISFFLRQKALYCSKDSKAFCYVTIAKLCCFIALGSSLFMFLIPVSGWRPSFLSLVFLIIGAATLFRLHEKDNNIKRINEKVKLMLKYLGCTYLFLTIAISLYANYLNWNYWREVLANINNKSQTLATRVLVITPPPTDKNYMFWRMASGTHLIYVPVVSADEQDRINKIVARYYNIKGIKVVPKEDVSNN